MTSEIEPSGDMQLFESYGRLINPAYPSFLNKLGLNRVAVKAQGATITDSEGKTYIDCVGGYGLFNVGHNNPEIIQAIIDQLKEERLFTKPLITQIQVEMAECMAKIAPGDLDCSFMLNSGSEAVECAIKLIRLHKGGKTIITAQNAFHGHTFGALTASGIPSCKRAFQPLLPGFVSIPFGDVEALSQAISPEVSAVLIEPIQNEAGINVPPEGYLQEVRNLCDRHGLYLALDEIKTGFGKTGRMFACEHYGVVPDILILGKSLGGGLIPCGAVVAKKELWKRFGLSFPMSASSYAGNVLACRAGLTTIQYIQRDSLLEDCTEKGKLLLQSFRDYVSEYPDILRFANGLGLLIGIHTYSAKVAFELAREMTREGVLVIPAFGNSSVLIVEPPLVISFQQVRTVADVFANACAKVSQAGQE